MTNWRAKIRYHSVTAKDLRNNAAASSLSLAIYIHLSEIQLACYILETPQQRIFLDKFQNGIKI